MPALLKIDSVKRVFLCLSCRKIVLNFERQTFEKLADFVAQIQFDRQTLVFLLIFPIILIVICYVIYYSKVNKD